MLLIRTWKIAFRDKTWSQPLQEGVEISLDSVSRECAGIRTPLHRQIGPCEKKGSVGSEPRHWQNDQDPGQDRGEDQTGQSVQGSSYPIQEIAFTGKAGSTVAPASPCSILNVCIMRFRTFWSMWLGSRSSQGGTSNYFLVSSFGGNKSICFPIRASTQWWSLCFSSLKDHIRFE